MPVFEGGPDFWDGVGDDVAGFLNGVVAGEADGESDTGVAGHLDVAVVVTQPEAGTYKAFSAICTHQGCLVGSVVAAFYYLRLIKAMWFDGTAGTTDKPPFEAKAIAVAAAVFTFPVVIVALRGLDMLAERAAQAFGLV